MTDPISTPPVRTGPPPAAAQKDDPLMKAAQALEGAFLSQMLKSAGFGEARGAFGGGVGEEQFGSLLRDQHANHLAEVGGIGLAEAIYNSMTGGGTQGIKGTSNE